MTNMRSRLSAEVRVMFHPKQVFAEPQGKGGPWLYWRRPLLELLMLCAGISLLVTGRFSLHMVGSSAIYWSFLPLAEILGLAAAERRWPDAVTVDRFFIGHGPWFLFLIAFAAFGSRPSTLGPWIAAAGGAVLWSCWIDYNFFGGVGKLVLNRIVTWTPFVVIFAGSWARMAIEGRLL
jgi:hypothetical protein